jgi:hypothetical protein
MRNTFVSTRKTLKGAPKIAPASAAGAEKRPTALATRRQCELCGGARPHGKYLGTAAGQPSIWACDDCQKMLLLRVNDEGTPGD